jgi:hypothetical protein
MFFACRMPAIGVAVLGDRLDHPGGIPRACRRDDRMRGRDLPSPHSVFTENCAVQRNRLATRENGSVADQGIFLPGILANHLRGLHSSTFDSFILPIWSSDQQGKHRCYGLILGVDPAGMGADRTAVVFRRGHRITGVETRYDLDTMDTAGRVGQIIRQEQPAGVNIDLGSW